MPRIKERRKIIHEPSTSEIFYCLTQYPAYSQILLENEIDKPFLDFLRWIISRNFYIERTQKLAIKKIAADYGADSAKVTKWIKEIYSAIFVLNNNRPELYVGDGIKVSLCMSYFDSHCYFDLSLPVLPREFETVEFAFAKAKVGISRFWVKRIEHQIEEKENMQVILWLDGGILNTYREYALDKALFHERISFMDIYDKPSFEIDEVIKKIYR